MKFQNKLSKGLFQYYKTRKLGFDYLFYNLIGNSFTLVLNFVLPIFLSIDDYGYYALLFSIFNVLSAIFTFGLDTTILKFSIEKNFSSNILITAFIGWSILAIPLVSILILTYYLTSYFFSYTISLFSISLIIFSASIISLQRITLSNYIGTEKSKKYGILFGLNKINQFILFLIFLFLFSKPHFLKLIPLIFLIQGLFNLGIIFFLEGNELLIRKLPSKIEIKALVKFTLPLSVNTFGNLGYSYGFNVLISPFLSLAQLGTLNIFVQFSNIASMTINALNNGYIPKFYKHFRENVRSAIFSYSKYILLNAFFLVTGIFLLGIVYESLILPRSNVFELWLFFIYCLSIFLYSFKSVGSNILVMKGKTLSIPIFTILTSIVTILIAIILTKQFGFLGCIIGISIGYVLQVIIFNQISFKSLSIARRSL